MHCSRMLRAPSARPGVASARVSRVQPRVAIKAKVFNEAFLQQLQESLTRQGSEAGDQVGIPGLTIQQTIAEGPDGTGSMVWTAGIRLAAHLTKNRADLIRGSRILELGSGTGIVGITCAALGGHVTLTDLPDLVQITQENVQANAHLVEEAGGSAQVAVLDWESPDEELLSQPYDWVIGSDLIYKADAVPVLAVLLRYMVLSNPDSMVKLAHRFRSKELDKYMREVFASQELVLRPVDVRTTGTTDYMDPIKAEESIIFYRVTPM